MKVNYDILKTIVVIALIAGAAYSSGVSHNSEWVWFLFLAWWIW
jgi:hypothetical protein